MQSERERPSDDELYELDCEAWNLPRPRPTLAIASVQTASPDDRSGHAAALDSGGRAQGVTTRHRGPGIGARSAVTQPSRARRRFETRSPGHPRFMRNVRASAPPTDSSSDAPTLVFVGRRHCGASRRMESLVAWVKVTQRKRLRVVDLDADRNPELAHHLGVKKTPTLLVLRNGAVLRRLEGRATGRQIEALIAPFVRDDSRAAA